MRSLCALVVLLAACVPLHAQVVSDELRLVAPAVSDTPIRIRVLLPPGYVDGESRYPVLYLNDGQDLQEVGVEATLQQLYAARAIQPLIVVAIDMPPDRMGGYGLFDRGARHSIPAQTKYGPVGTNAWAYAQWVTATLVPAIDGRYRTLASAEERAILGWSLGALSAFGIGWQYPELFGRIGALSPAFWVSADRNGADAIIATRLVHRLLNSGARMHRPQVFLAVGTAEETDDRDGDGTIDVIDDARDLLDGWKGPDGVLRKGLRQLGYSVNLEDPMHASAESALLYVLDGGQHNQAGWARMLPIFLRWAYGPRVQSIDANAKRLPGSVMPRATHPR